MQWKDFYSLPISATIHWEVFLNDWKESDIWPNYFAIIQPESTVVKHMTVKDHFSVISDRWNQCNGLLSSYDT